MQKTINMDADKLFEIIKSRRAVMPAMYSDENISDSELKLIIESANWAPTHKKTEPWRFKVIGNNSKKSFADFMTTQYKNITAPEKQSERKIDGINQKVEKSDKILLICVKFSGLLPEWEEIASVAASVQNMWLMCTALGIGSYWSSPAMIEKMGEFTELEENEKCIGVFYMGKLNIPLYEGSRIPIDEKIKYLS